MRAIPFPGIEGAKVESVSVPIKEITRIKKSLATDGDHTEVNVRVNIRFFVRKWGGDLATWTESGRFRVQVCAQGDDVQAWASSEKDWTKAWERAVNPFLPAIFQNLCDQLRSRKSDWREENPSFRAAMILLASMHVGPFVGPIATCLRYPLEVVQIVANRARSAAIWEGNMVNFEPWLHPIEGASTFLMDAWVAEGKLTRERSNEKNKFTYGLLQGLARYADRVANSDSKRSSLNFV